MFDGHGGMDASYYTVAQFLQNLVKEPGKDKSKALYDAFSKTDLGFSAKAAREVKRQLPITIIVISSSISYQIRLHIGV